MTTKQDAMERARELAVDGHCRYCDRRGDPRVKCDRDIELQAEDIAAALLAVRKETREEDANAALKLFVQDEQKGTMGLCIAQSIRKLEE